MHVAVSRQRFEADTAAVHGLDDIADTGGRHDGLCGSSLPVPADQ